MDVSSLFSQLESFQPSYLQEAPKALPPGSDPSPLLQSLLDLISSEDFDTLTLDPYSLSLPALLSLFTNSKFPTSVNELAIKIFLVYFAKEASPREAFLGMMERMERLSPIASAEGEGDEETDERVAPFWELEGILNALSIVLLHILRSKRPSSFITTLSQSIPSSLARLRPCFVPTSQSSNDPTLDLSLSFGVDSGESSNQEQSKQMKKRKESQDAAAAILKALGDLMDALVTESKPPWIEPEKEKCLLELRILLLRTISSLHPYVPALSRRHLSKRWFAKVEPKWTVPVENKGKDGVDRGKVEEVEGMRGDVKWGRMEITAQETLSTNSLHCLSTIEGFIRSATLSGSSPNEESSEVDDDRAQQRRLNSSSTAFGAFLFIVHSLFGNVIESASPSATPSVSSAKKAKETLSITLPFVMVIMNSGGPTAGDEQQPAYDEGLFWIWWHAREVIQGGEHLDDSTMFRLVQLFSPIISTCPLPHIRFIGLRLLSYLLTNIASNRESTQFILLKDLLTESPWDDLRAEAIGILKQVVGKKLEPSSSAGEEGESSPASSIFASPLLLHELGGPLFSLPPRDDSDTEEFGVLGSRMNLTLQKTGFYYFLLCRDTENKTGVTSTSSLISIEQNLLHPLRTRVETAEHSLNSQTETGTSSSQAAESLQQGSMEQMRKLMDLEILKSSFGRVDEFIKERNLK